MRHAFRLFCLVLLAAVGSSLRGGATVPQSADPAKFVVLMRGIPIGTEFVSVSGGATGWTISSTGRQGRPIDLTTTKFEMKYTPDWQPVQLTVDALLGGKPLKIATSFGLTTAITEMTQGEKTGTA